MGCLRPAAARRPGRPRCGCAGPGCRRRWIGGTHFVHRQQSQADLPGKSPAWPARPARYRPAALAMAADSGQCGRWRLPHALARLTAVQNPDGAGWWPAAWRRADARDLLLLLKRGFAQRDQVGETDQQRGTSMMSSAAAAMLAQSVAPGGDTLGIAGARRFLVLVALLDRQPSCANYLRFEAGMIAYRPTGMENGQKYWVGGVGPTPRLSRFKSATGAHLKLPRSAQRSGVPGYPFAARSRYLLRHPGHSTVASFSSLLKPMLRSETSLATNHVQPLAHQLAPGRTRDVVGLRGETHGKGAGLHCRDGGDDIRVAQQLQAYLIGALS